MENQMLSNPLFYILIANLVGIYWAFRSWKKNMQERWMNNLRDAASELMGSSEHLYGLDWINHGAEVAVAKSQIIAKEQKLLLLFSEGSETQKSFKKLSRKLSDAADERITKDYRDAFDNFSSLANQRIMKEWRKVKRWW